MGFAVFFYTLPSAISEVVFTTVRSCAHNKIEVEGICAHENHLH